MLIVPGTKFRDKVSKEILTVAGAVGGVVFSEENGDIPYRVAQIELLQQSKKKIICLIGKSGSGKSTIEKLLVERLNLPKGVSTTTRQPREGEQHGVDYYYITEEEFLKKSRNRELLEETCYNGWYYGLELSEYENAKDSLVLVCNPHGYRQILERVGQENVISFYIMTSDKNRLMRALQREENPNCYEIARRLIGDTNDFVDLELEVDYSLSNDGNSVEEIYQFIKTAIEDN